MKKSAIVAFAALVAAGCVSNAGPHYERASGPSDFGYYETRVSDNRYTVQYRADEAGAYAEDFAMRRAAELTLDRGYQWFQVISRSRAFDDRFFDRYEGMRYYGDDSSYRDRPRYGDYDGDSLAILEIVMGYNPPPRGASIYDARRVLDRGDRY